MSHRVAQRLGLIGPKTSALAAHDRLEAQLPPDRYYDFHVALIGTDAASATLDSPRCRDCVLRNRCPAAAQFLSNGG